MTSVRRAVLLAFAMWLVTSERTAAQSLPDWMKVSRVSVLASEAVVAEPTPEAHARTMRKKMRRAAHVLTTGLTLIVVPAITTASFAAGGLCSREAAVKPTIALASIGAVLTAIGAWKLSQVPAEDRELSPSDEGFLALNGLVFSALTATPLVLAQAVNCD